MKGGAWEVLECTKREHSRFGLHVTLVNHFDGDRKCYWTINEHGILNPEYDWSNCRFGDGAKERFEECSRFASLEYARKNGGQ